MAVKKVAILSVYGNSLLHRKGSTHTTGGWEPEVTDKVATDSWGNWSSSCGDGLNSIGYRLSAASRPASRT